MVVTFMLRAGRMLSGNTKFIVDTRVWLLEDHLRNKRRTTHRKKDKETTN